MSVGFFSITRNCINRGNLIIEHATREILDIDEPLIEIDAHQPLSRTDIDALNGCRAIVFPGATLLQPEDHAAVARLDEIRVPILAIGSALRSVTGVADVAVAQRLRCVSGSRDPFTHQALLDAGIPTRLVGCPVMLLGASHGWQLRDGPIVYSPGLGNQRAMVECAAACAELGPTVVLEHAPERQSVGTMANVTAVPLASAEQAFELIRGGSVVVTSRMHAFLSAMLFGTPAIFLGGWYDSRYSLLEFLGVPIEPPIPQRVRKLVAACRDGSKTPPDVCFERADVLRAAQVEWMTEAGAPLGIRLRRSHVTC